MGLRSQSRISMMSFPKLAKAHQGFLAWASLLLTGIIFFLISLGGLVRNEDAGLACPDWPLCFGKVVPPMDYQIFLEWFHRLIAGSVSLTLLTVCSFIFFKADLRRYLGKLAAASLALLLAQVVLGGLTVLGLLDPKWVSSHLAIGIAFFGTVLVMSLKLRDLDRTQMMGMSFPGLYRLGCAVIAVVYLQILLGGAVSSHYAGLACGATFPSCNGEWWPPFEGVVRFHWLHRIGAAIATTSIVLLLAASLRAPLGSRGRVASRFVVLLLAAQIFLGVGSVVWGLPLLMSVAHLAVAAALFGTLLVMVYEIKRC